MIQPVAVRDGGSSDESYSSSTPMPKSANVDGTGISRYRMPAIWGIARTVWTACHTTSGTPSGRGTPPRPSSDGDAGNA